jgi:hypothetical protein
MSKRASVGTYAAALADRIFDDPWQANIERHHRTTL